MIEIFTQKKLPRYRGTPSQAQQTPISRASHQSHYITHYNIIINVSVSAKKAKKVKLAIDLLNLSSKNLY